MKKLSSRPALGLALCFSFSSSFFFFGCSSQDGGTGGAPGTGGATATGGTATGGGTSSGGSTPTGGASGAGANTGGARTGGQSGAAGRGATGGRPATGGGVATGGNNAGGATAAGGRSPGSTGGAGGANSATGGGSGTGSGPVGTLSGPLSTGIVFLDEKGTRVNAHGGGIIQVGDTFYLHGEYFPPGTSTDGNFAGFSMYSSKDMATWTFERMIVPLQASGELGPNRKGERPHIIKCPSSGEYVLYAHAADETYQADKEVVYATSATVNGAYDYKGPLKNAQGAVIAHSDMSAYADETGGYVLTESGHVFTLSSDCHSWLSDKSVSVNGDSGGAESPTVFRADKTYYWIGSYKTGWRANNNFYSTASAITGPWTYQGFLAPVADASDKLSDQRTWMSQSTWVQPVTGSKGTVYVYWGDHWSGNQDTTAPGKHNDQAGYVFQPLVFTGTKIGLPEYHATWKLDVGQGTWSP